MITWLFNKSIDKAERDTGYPADYLRDILAASKMGFVKLMLAFLTPHPKHADRWLHHIAQLGAIQQEACGPCLEISKSYAIASGVPEATIKRLLRNPENTEPLTQAAFMLGRHVAGGLPLDDTLKAVLEQNIGTTGLAELTVSAAAVRIYPALKRGLGYADMCAIPEPMARDDTHEQPSAGL